MLVNELEILIEELEAEKYNLQFLIDTAVKEKEYLTAYFHNEALRKNAAQLSILYNLYDKSYYVKNKKMEERYHYYQLLKVEEEEYAQNYIKSKIEALNAELERLQANQVIPLSTDQQNISTHVDLLIREEISTFRIVLFKSEKVIIEIKKHKEETCIRLMDYDRGINFSINSQLPKLKALGFVEVDLQTTLQITLPNTEGELKNQIMTLLSILTLEIFHCNGPNSQAYIELV